ncbi:hypothetical protein Tco_0988002 [Tanacetum coccineum]|uniref:Myb-like domain-containing protein n=1 Tax=Tanacetum coccineum TaxID=301880 RepID=A0ABQ5EPS2_9ASTR
MESSTSSQPYQPYSPINPTNLDMNFEELMFSQEYNYSQDYSMGHDDSPVEEVSPVKPKKPSRHEAKAKKDETKKVKEPPKEWTVEEEIALYQGWCDVSENNISGNTMKAKEFWEAVIRGDFNLEHCYNILKDHPGRDRSKAKKKASGSSSSIVDLVADKFYNMKQKKRKERQGTTCLYGDEESRVKYPGGRGSRNCTTEKGETRNSTSNA